MAREKMVAHGGSIRFSHQKRGIQLAKIARAGLLYVALSVVKPNACNLYQPKLGDGGLLVSHT